VRRDPPDRPGRRRGTASSLHGTTTLTIWVGSWT
jgi:hypothetical protein